MDWRAVQQLFDKHVRCVRLRSTQSPDCCGSSFSLQTASLCHCPAAQRHPYSSTVATDSAHHTNHKNSHDQGSLWSVKATFLRSTRM